MQDKYIGIGPESVDLMSALYQAGKPDLHAILTTDVKRDLDIATRDATIVLYLNFDSDEHFFLISDSEGVLHGINIGEKYDDVVPEPIRENQKRELVEDLEAATFSTADAATLERVLAGTVAFERTADRNRQSWVLAETGVMEAIDQIETSARYIADDRARRRISKILTRLSRQYEGPQTPGDVGATKMEADACSSS